MDINYGILREIYPVSVIDIPFKMGISMESMAEYEDINPIYKANLQSFQAMM